MKILILDNYDSFTFNLYQTVGELLQNNGEIFQLHVMRNDTITIDRIKKQHYDRIIISPGPGDPSDLAYFGVCKEVILTVSQQIPTLGVCLGMQGIAYYYGGSIIRAPIPMHGKTSIIRHNGKGIFSQIPQEIAVMRYHSLIVDARTLTNDFVITATVIGSQELMGIRHKRYPIEGIQFHPESFATEAGSMILNNFIFQI